MGKFHSVKPYINYSEIQPVERKALAAEAYRRSSHLRMIRFGAVFIPIMLSVTVARELAAEAAMLQIAAPIGVALVACLVIWECFGRPKLRAEVERLKNA